MKYQNLMQEFFKSWFKYVHIRNLNNNKMKKSFLNIIPPHNTLFDASKLQL